MYGNVFDSETERMLLKSILESDKNNIKKIYDLTKLLLGAVDHFYNTITNEELKKLSFDTQSILLVIKEAGDRIKKYYGKK